uniref:G-protein coupled receptors family 1 profile domain-containing protein n=1 Tax=Knipowitschia caucasica TaxID=637954 RepID=A0AAV2LCM3_KNICA
MEPIDEYSYYTDYTVDYDENNDSINLDLDLNNYCEPGEHTIIIKVFQSCFFCLIFITGVIGNCLVISTFSLYRRFRLRSLTDVFLFHLAMADLLLLLTLPLQATDTHLAG